MKILLYEDRALTAMQLKSSLEDNKYEVDICFSCRDLSKRITKSDYDIYIMDLNGPVDGLSPEQILESKNGLFTGWIFIRDYIWKSMTNDAKKIIVFSDYVKLLKNHIETNGSKEERQLFNQLDNYENLIEKSTGYLFLINRISK